MNWDKIAEAYAVVERGLAKRIDLEGGIVVYQAGSIIRIDFKEASK